MFVGTFVGQGGGNSDSGNSESSVKMENMLIQICVTQIVTVSLRSA